MYDVKVTQDIINIYSPNDLRSYYIIYQLGIVSSLHLNDGYFIGSFSGVALSSGSATIINCSFQQMSQAISLWDVDGFTMKYSEIKNNGQYNGPFISDYDRDTYETAGFEIWSSNNIIISHTVFSGFDPRGLIYIQESSSILFEDNTMNAEMLKHVLKR